ncbi:MAG: hypothetical protein N2112_10550 [Gemmataceae bacterium]|jgi:hypothetical protein|nr:hypothetical protein [Gemmataceae bacterium]
MSDRDELFKRLATLEQTQGRTSRRLRILGAFVILQTILIAYLVLPIVGIAKHPLTVQAGSVEIIDRNGIVRAELSAELGQSLLALRDATGQSQVLLRTNETGFSTLELFDRASDRKSVVLFSGSKRSFLEFRAPDDGRRVSIQAGEGELGLRRLDERGQVVPTP